MEALPEMERFDPEAGQEEKGAVSLVVDLAEASGKVQMGHVLRVPAEGVENLLGECCARKNKI